jgi:hypothetical protein
LIGSGASPNGPAAAAESAVTPGQETDRIRIHSDRRLSAGRNPIDKTRREWSK